MTEAAKKVSIQKHKRHPIVAGEKHHRLTAVEKIKTDRPGTYWKFKCECGNDFIALSYAVRSGNTKSCGCLKSQVTSNKNKIHGLSKRPEYRVWKGMLNRCRNPNCRQASDYGGRGIRVCDRWLNFANFFADMGPRPSASYSIERRDNNGGYEPDNCCWATRGAQNRNQRRHRLFLVNGKQLNLIDAAKEVGIAVCTIQRRLKKGLSEEQALSKRDYRRDDHA